MFSTPSKRTGSSTYKSLVKKPPGIFEDGVWHCNCNPHLPASHFQVKKEGPNKGKWFYSCQESKDSGCGFFLWDENAKGREMQAVIKNTRSEPDYTRTPSDASMDRRTVAGHSAASNKFMADLAKADEDEFGDWSLSAEDEKELVQAVESTPRKTAKTEHLATPGSKRKRDEDTLPTPAAGVSLYNARPDEDIFTTPASKLKGGMWDGNEHRSPSATPTPSRYRQSSIDRQQQNYDMSEEILDLLKDQNIDEETMAKLRQSLNRHALKISGIAKGRDITRVALKLKDTKIVELQQKISALETEREMDKTIIRHFNSDVTQRVERRRGRGKGKKGKNGHSAATE